jgi:flavin prenyltransferase
VTGGSSPVVVAITGGSGAPYALELLRGLLRAHREVWLLISSYGWQLLETELGLPDPRRMREAVGAEDWDARVRIFDDEDRGASPASGSARWSAMVVCPCSMGTLSAIAHGSSRSLIERAADVALKERRPLVLVPRETPLSIVHLENMLTVSRAGAVVLPASPGFYHRPRDIDDLVRFVVARVLDQLGVDQALVPRWDRS